MQFSRKREMGKLLLLAVKLGYSLPFWYSMCNFIIDNILANYIFYYNIDWGWSQIIKIDFSSMENPDNTLDNTSDPPLTATAAARMSAAEVSNLLDTPDSDDDSEQPPHTEEAMDTGDCPTADPNLETGGGGATGVSAIANPPALSLNTPPPLGESENATSGSDPPVGGYRRPGSGLYTAIRDIRVKSYVCPGLYGSESNCILSESFRNMGDDRHEMVKENNLLASASNISLSFDPVRMICKACTIPHSVGKRGEQHRPVFVVSDQCFPALTPPEGPGGCLAIMRMEDATLRELADLLLTQIRRQHLIRGTVVLIMSGGHLARVGAAQYALDLVEAVNILKKELPPASFVAHGPLMFTNGLNCMGTVRAVADVCYWQAALDSNKAVGDFLPVANKAVVRLIERRGTAGAQPLFPLRLAMPANMASSKTKIWASEGSTSLPMATVPLDEADEAEMLFFLTTELNRKLSLGLDCQLSTARKNCANGDGRIYLVGNGHAECLSRAGQVANKEVVMIPVRTLSEAEIAFAAKSFREAIAKTPMTIRAKSQVIFCLLDEALYMAKTVEGGWTPLRPPKKGVQHVEGELTLAPRERVKEICTSISPLLTAANGVPAVLLMPLPRWPEGPCCGKEGHMLRYDSETYLTNLLSKLEQTRRGVRDFVRMNKIEGVRVANLAKTVLEATGPWSSPLVPNFGAYQALLAKAIDEIGSRTAESIQAKQAKRSGQESGPPSKRPNHLATPSERGPEAAGQPRHGHGLSEANNRAGWTPHGSGASGGRGGRGRGANRSRGGHQWPARRPTW